MARGPARKLTWIAGEVASLVVPTFAGGPGVFRAYECWAGRARTFGRGLWFGHGDRSDPTSTVGPVRGGGPGLAAKVARPRRGGVRGRPDGLRPGPAADGGRGAGVVAAPSKLQRLAADRIKTDARDALHLARLLRMDQIVEVRVPSIEQEAARDLVRAREECGVT